MRSLDPSFTTMTRKSAPLALQHGGDGGGDHRLFVVGGDHHIDARNFRKRRRPFAAARSQPQHQRDAQQTQRDGGGEGDEQSRAGDALEREDRIVDRHDAPVAGGERRHGGGFVHAAQRAHGDELVAACAQDRDQLAQRANRGGAVAAAVMEKDGVAAIELGEHGIAHILGGEPV
ncbi:MAG: hypothetical protein AB7G04_03140, partial [Hyphomonadaceae bacterium]